MCFIFQVHTPICKNTDFFLQKLTTKGEVLYIVFYSRTRPRTSLQCFASEQRESKAKHCTEVRFASLLSGGFITAIAVNPPEK